MTSCIMRVIFRGLCVLPCLERQLQHVKKRAKPLLFFPNAQARHKLSPLAFLRLLSKHRRAALALNDQRRSQVAWIFVYLPTTSMEVFLPVSQEYPRNPNSFIHFPVPVVLTRLKTFPFTAVSLLSPSRGAERKKNVVYCQFQLCRNTMLSS